MKSPIFVNSMIKTSLKQGLQRLLGGTGVSKAQYPDSKCPSMHVGGLDAQGGTPNPMGGGEITMTTPSRHGARAGHSSLYPRVQGVSATQQRSPEAMLGKDSSPSQT